MTILADEALTAPEAQEDTSKPYVCTIHARSVFTPPPAVVAGIGNRQVRYETWLDKCFRDGFSAFDQVTSSNPAGQDSRLSRRIAARAGKTEGRADHLRQLFRTLATLAVKEKELPVVQYATAPGFHPKGIDIPAAVSKLVKANLGILYAIAPYLGIPTKQAVDITDSKPVDPIVPVTTTSLRRAELDAIYADIAQCEAEAENAKLNPVLDVVDAEIIEERSPEA